MKTEMLFKVLHVDGRPLHGGSGSWSLPHGNSPGEWMPKIKGKLIPCHNGYHLCRLQDLLKWLGPMIYLAEAGGECIVTKDKVVVRTARLLKHLSAWDRQAMILFATDCAEHVLQMFETQFPKDDRPRKAIEAARKYAEDGKNADASYTAAFAADDAAFATYAAYVARAALAADAAFAAAHAADAAAHAAFDAPASDAPATDAAFAASNAAFTAHAAAAADAAFAAAHAADAAHAAAHAARAADAHAADAAHAAAHATRAADANAHAEEQWQTNLLRQYLGVKEKP